MKNTQKGFVVPLLLAIIALLVIGGGVYLYSQKAKAPAVVNNEVATSSPMTISGEYDYSDMSGIAAFVVPGSSGSRAKEYNFGDAETRFNQIAHNQIAGSLSPFSDSCNLGIEATVEIKDPKLVKVDEKRNAEMYQATFVRLISKGNVYDNCAGDGGVVTKTERKTSSDTITSISGQFIYPKSAKDTYRGLLDIQPNKGFVSEYNFGENKTKTIEDEIFNNHFETSGLSCSWLADAQVEIKNPQLIGVDKFGTKQYQAVFVKLVSKGEVHQVCAN